MITKIVFSPAQLQEMVDDQELLKKVAFNLRTIPSCTVAMAVAFAKSQMVMEFSNAANASLNNPEATGVAPEREESTTNGSTDDTPEPNGGSSSVQAAAKASKKAAVPAASH